VLHPDYASISRYGEPRLGARVLWARVTGRMAALSRSVIEPVYKPIHWLMADGVPVGSSSQDLDRLAELGREWLEHAGVRPSDVVVSVVPPGPTLGYWELVLAARRAGLSALFLPSDATVAQVARLRPTVLAGRPAELERVLSGPPEDLPLVHTVLAVDEPLGAGQRERLEHALSPMDAVVLSAWAPRGVRSLWTECRGRAGLHLTPTAEHVETVDGEVVWTALGWSGTVFVRLRTGVAGSLDERPCPSCGRVTGRVRTEAVAPAPAPSKSVSEPVPPRGPVRPRREPTPTPMAEPEPELEPAPEPEPAPMRTAPAAPFASMLDGHPGVGVWQAELRTHDGEEELFVFFSAAGPNGAMPVLHELAAELAVTQWVVLPEDELVARLARHDHRQVVDLR
jgi:hypothetical protein